MCVCVCVCVCVWFGFVKPSIKNHWALRTACIFLTDKADTVEVGTVIGSATEDPITA